MRKALPVGPTTLGFNLKAKFSPASGSQRGVQFRVKGGGGSVCGWQDWKWALCPFARVVDSTRLHGMAHVSPVALWAFGYGRASLAQCRRTLAADDSSKAGLPFCKLGWGEVRLAALHHAALARAGASHAARAASDN